MKIKHIHITTAITILLLTTAASAQERRTPDPKRAAEAKRPAKADVPAPVQISTSLMAFAHLTWLEDSDRMALRDQPGSFSYPGFYGISGHGALLIDLQVTGQRYWSIETGFIYSKDTGEGEVGFDEVTFSQWATHVPLMVKLRAPGLHDPGAFYFMPVAGIGVEGVFPSKPSLSSEAEQVTSAKADPYMLALIMFGSEFRFPIKDAGELALRFDLVRVGANTVLLFGERGLFTEEGGEVELITEFDLHISSGAGLTWQF